MLGVSKIVKNTSRLSVAVLAVRAFLVLCFLTLVLTQLFKFEKFPEFIRSFGVLQTMPPEFLAILIVSLEVLALPFLIKLDTSKIVLTISGVAAFWALIILSILEVAAHKVGRSMIFAPTFSIYYGWCGLAILFIAMIAFAIFTIYELPNIKIVKKIH